MKQKQKDILMLVQRFQLRNRTQKNPIVLAGRIAWYSALDLLSSAVRAITVVGATFYVTYMFVFEPQTEVPLVRLGLFIAAAWTFRVALMSFAKPLLPELPELLIVYKWHAFVHHLKETALWDQLCGVETQEELNVKVGEYFFDLASDIGEALNKQNLWQYVAFQHLYLRARSVAEGLLGVPVPQLSPFEVDASIFAVGTLESEGVPEDA